MRWKWVLICVLTHIVVSVPGLDDPARIRRMLMTTAALEITGLIANLFTALYVSRAIFDVQLRHAKARLI
ncbi:MAG: hypothetical protein FJW20_24470 [Acidimicrobiia bacterium]|nr:hypothetical protein [Acidimicrobiia bacterium]